MKTWSTKIDLSVFDHEHFTAIWLKNTTRKKGKKMKGRKERKGEKKGLTFTLVFILSNLEREKHVYSDLPLKR